MECINNDVSLFDLICERKKTKDPVRIKEINAQIKELETLAKKGNVTIRLM